MKEGVYTWTSDQQSKARSIFDRGSRNCTIDCPSLRKTRAVLGRSLGFAGKCLGVGLLKSLERGSRRRESQAREAAPQECRRSSGESVGTRPGICFSELCAWSYPPREWVDKGSSGRP